jgi:hypothetical protein
MTNNNNNSKAALWISAIFYKKELQRIRSLRETEGLTERDNGGEQDKK